MLTNAVVSAVMAGTLTLLCEEPGSWKFETSVVSPEKDVEVMRIRLDGTLDDDASVGVIYGAAAGDQFGTYVSGDRMSARAFCPTWSDDPKLRGGTRDTKLVWKTPTGLLLLFR